MMCESISKTNPHFKMPHSNTTEFRIMKDWIAYDLKKIGNFNEVLVDHYKGLPPVDNGDRGLWLYNVLKIEIFYELTRVLNSDDSQD